MPIDQAAIYCGVSVGMLSKLENGKGVNLEHALRVMDGLGLTMLVVPRAYGNARSTKHRAGSGWRALPRSMPAACREKS
ncbi:helix-turn-helix transcriptional regulator [Cupriavidus sp. AcVe19-6a]|nr:helix-turn-helix transcriptional regulator [Cupriavidus sp. AcVe19-6a]MBP0639001.1 helix-turn-helix transcriptional regulator [Cupriavidus sp. AcVe19-6a]